MKANDYCNYWRFQLHWNKLEWVDQEMRKIKKNPFCSSTQQFYIKNGKLACHFVGHSKLNPIDCFQLFKLQ